MFTRVVHGTPADGLPGRGVALGTDRKRCQLPVQGQQGRRVVHPLHARQTQTPQVSSPPQLVISVMQVMERGLGRLGKKMNAWVGEIACGGPRRKTARGVSGFGARGGRDLARVRTRRCPLNHLLPPSQTSRHLALNFVHGRVYFYLTDSF
jgi:hypothetical protein